MAFTALGTKQATNAMGFERASMERGGIRGTAPKRGFGAQCGGGGLGRRTLRFSWAWGARLLPSAVPSWLAQTTRHVVDAKGTICGRKGYWVGTLLALRGGHQPGLWAESVDGAWNAFPLPLGILKCTLRTGAAYQFSRSLWCHEGAFLTYHAHVVIANPSFLADALQHRRGARPVRFRVGRAIQAD